MTKLFIHSKLGREVGLLEGGAGLLQGVSFIQEYLREGMMPSALHGKAGGGRHSGRRREGTCCGGLGGDVDVDAGPQHGVGAAGLRGDLEASAGTLKFRGGRNRTRRLGALKAWATPEEIITVLPICVSMGVGVCAKGGPILAEVLAERA